MPPGPTGILKRAAPRVLRFWCRDRYRVLSEWFVYIVLCSDGSLYTGVSPDIKERVATHNAGRGAKYTRGRLPVRLVYREQHADRSAALRREAEIKRMTAEKKRKLIRGSSTGM